MRTPLFFKLFPPPQFLLMHHAGLVISDDALRCLEYRLNAHGNYISKYGSEDLPDGLVESGDIKDEKKFNEILVQFAKKNRLSYVKVSVPEEKAYLFQTDVPGPDTSTASQNIEFKLEQNVPLSASDAMFYFDLMPPVEGTPAWRASVSVVARSYIEQQIALLSSAGLTAVGFDVVPRAAVRSMIPRNSSATQLIVHFMNHKVGLYIASGGVVCFSSTLPLESHEAKAGPSGPAIVSADILTREINRVYSYWMTREDVRFPISSIILCGRYAMVYENLLHNQNLNNIPSASIANVWTNSLNLDSYIPPISHDDSLLYAVASGMAL